MNKVMTSSGEKSRNFANGRNYGLKESVEYLEKELFGAHDETTKTLIRKAITDLEMIRKTPLALK